jgi:hypothetical protein
MLFLQYQLGISQEDGQVHPGLSIACTVPKSDRARRIVRIMMIMSADLNIVAGPAQAKYVHDF